MITKKYYKLIRVSYADSDLFRITNTSDQSGTLTFTKYSKLDASSAEYSTDGVNFSAMTFDNNVFTLNNVLPGMNVYMKGNVTAFTGTQGQGFGNINMDVQHSVGGNILSIVDKTNYASLTTSDYALFGSAFKDNTHLNDASKLNFGHLTTVQKEGMYFMFNGCTSLTSTPDLSSVTTVGRGGMQNMFNGCTSLTSTPDLSSVTTVDYQGMQNMFNGCSVLSTAPNLSNITTVGDYGMKEMFKNCASLIVGPDITNATSIGTQSMLDFLRLCSHLTTAYAPTITWDTNKMSNWLNGVSASGTLYADASIASTIPTNNNSGCPNGWTVATL